MNNTSTTEIGYVTSTRDFLIHVDGLPTIHINDMVESENGGKGWVNSLGESSVEVLMLSEEKIEPGKSFKKLSTKLSIPVGNFLLGRSINPLAIPIDGKGPLEITKTTQFLDLDKQALGIEARKFINNQFLTGITMIDSLIPIGSGQRELVLGDAHSGKTQFLIDTIINQKNTDVICVYASIGKPSVSVRNLIDVLSANNAIAHTIIIAASSSEVAPLIYLTPKTALTIAEYFQSKGKNVLLILDDLGSHAKIYREIALLGDKSPGRESYPGDIFYQHARLLERAGNFLPEFGGGSITALPVIELNLSDFTTLIPTNLMSMTDGHLMFKSSLRSQGQIPAIDMSLSVSRVGRQTQSKLSNLLSLRIKQTLSSAADLETVSRFSSELSEETQLILRRKELIMEMLKQDPFTAIPRVVQMILIALPFTDLFKNKTKSFIEIYKQKLIDLFLNDPQLSLITKSVSKFATDDQLIKELNNAEGVIAKNCP